MSMEEGNIPITNSQNHKTKAQKPKRPLSIPDSESRANVTLSLYLSDTGKRLVTSPNAIVSPL